MKKIVFCGMILCTLSLANGPINNEAFARDLFRMIINHSDHATRLRYLPMLEEAFQKGKAQPLRYAKMQDRLLVEEGKEQRYGTQWRFDIDWKVEQK